MKCVNYSVFLQILDFFLNFSISNNRVFAKVVVALIRAMKRDFSRSIVNNQILAIPMHTQQASALIMPKLPIILRRFQKMLAFQVGSSTFQLQQKSRTSHRIKIWTRIADGSTEYEINAWNWIVSEFPFFFWI